MRHLKPGGELVFIVPREFIKLTAAKKLNAWLYAQGSITHFYETGDVRVFDGATPNCAIFRFEKGRFDRQMADGRIFTEVDGQLMFLRDDHRVRFADVFTVKVGAVSGADHIFAHPKGNMEFVYSKTVDTGETRRMLYGIKHRSSTSTRTNCLPAACASSTKATGGSGAAISRSTNCRASTSMAGRAARSPSSCTIATPSTAPSWPVLNNRRMQRRDLIECTMMLNKEVDWQQLGFVCDGRFIFTQRSLQTCLLPDKFSRYFPKDPHDLYRPTAAAWQKNNSLLCVGLDPDPAKFPAHLKGRDDAIFEFCAAIVDATADLVCAFKPQIAYFAARRAEDQLEALIAHIHESTRHPGHSRRQARRHRLHRRAIRRRGLRALTRPMPSRIPTWAATRSSLTWPTRTRASSCSAAPPTRAARTCSSSMWR
jgi:hypothetical protein